MNQNPKTNSAGTLTTRIKNPKNIKVEILALGKVIIYAPKTPAMAPDAPTIGI